MDLEDLVLCSCLSWEPNSARAPEGSTISFLGTLAVPAPIHCEFFLPMIHQIQANKVPDLKLAM